MGNPFIEEKESKKKPINKNLIIVIISCAMLLVVIVICLKLFLRNNHSSYAFRDVHWKMSLENVLQIEKKDKELHLISEVLDILQIYTFSGYRFKNKLDCNLTYFFDKTNGLDGILLSIDKEQISQKELAVFLTDIYGNGQQVEHGILWKTEESNLVLRDGGLWAWLVRYSPLNSKNDLPAINNINSISTDAGSKDTISQPKEVSPPPIYNKFSQISIRVIEKNIVQRKYDEFIELVFVVDNAHAKTIKGIEGTMIVKDMFGKRIMGIEWDIFHPIKPSTSVTIHDVGMNYNQFMDDHQKLYTTPFDSLIFEYEFNTVIFTDGSSIKK